MLQLESLERKRLQALRALTIDEDGDETLLGLTVAESIFVLDFAAAGRDEFDTAELDLYIRLQARHVDTWISCTRSLTPEKAALIFGTAES